MIEGNIKTVILYRKDLKEDSKFKQNTQIELCDFIFKAKHMMKMELVIFSDVDYSKILISRYFSI